MEFPSTLNDQPSTRLPRCSASSLDYVVLADFSGNIAPEAERMERVIQALLVDAANEHGWVIPFQQITIHQTA